MKGGKITSEEQRLAKALEKIGRMRPVKTGPWNTGWSDLNGYENYRRRVKDVVKRALEGEEV